jgi:hypothetical protein
MRYIRTWVFYSIGFWLGSLFCGDTSMANCGWPILVVAGFALVLCLQGVADKLGKP